VRAFTVKTDGDPARVWKLAYETYRAAGYCDDNPCGMLAHYIGLDGIPETEVYAVEDDDGKMIATNSATIDGPRGLHTDHAFPRETEVVREECLDGGLWLGSSWRIASDPSCRKRLEPVVKVIEYTLQQFGPKLDVCLFTFNPRHARVYKYLLKLKIIAESPSDPTVKASVVLMRGELPVMREAWARRTQGR